MVAWRVSNGAAHQYEAHIRWTGNRGDGTRAYGCYGRDHVLTAPGKPDVGLSSDAAFRGDATRFNPEDLLVASLASCHMLQFLHLAATHGITVTAYEDAAVGTMVENGVGGGHFAEVILAPRVTIAAGDPALAERLHEDAHALCFIAASVNFPVLCRPSTVRETAGAK